MEASDIYKKNTIFNWSNKKNIDRNEPKIIVKSTSNAVQKYVDNSAANCLIKEETI